MKEARTLVRDARGRAGLSTRALAQLAGVSTATVARVERGVSDPTCGMLERLMAAAGEELVMDTRPASSPTPALARLTHAWQRTTEGDVPDWTRLRALLDYLSRQPQAIADAIAPAASNSGSRVIDALLAAVAEKLADDAGLERPPWVRTAPRLAPDEWPRFGTPRMVQQWRRTTPKQLVDRGIIIDAGTLWRHMQPAHA